MLERILSSKEIRKFSVFYSIFYHYLAILWRVRFTVSYGARIRALKFFEKFLDDFEIAICRCLVYLFEHSNDKSSVVVVRRLSSLCSSKNPDTRIKAAFSLAKLLEVRPDLQELAFYSHQLPKKIQKFFQLPQGALDGCSQSQVRKFTKELNAYSRYFLFEFSIPEVSDHVTGS